jgi:nucleoside 2-deoxyribosyltransferase
MKNFTIYLAGPITGKGYEEVVSSYAEKTTYFEAIGYNVLCPMTGKSYLRNEIEFKSENYKFPVSTNHAIFERDMWMVSNCDIILADLSNSGERVSIGTMMELAWASLLHKHSVIILPENNVHRHAFVLESGDIIFEAYEEAKKYLEDFIIGIKQ